MSGAKQQQTVRETLMRNLPAIRDVRDCTQDDLARSAQDHGFSWTRTTVAEIESGDRSLGAEELLALPSIISRAFQQVKAPRDATWIPVTLANILDPGHGWSLEVANGFVLGRKQVTEWLAAEPPSIKRRAATPRIGEADHKAARSLGVSVEELMAATDALWGRGSLTNERDHQLRQMDTGTGSRRAVRGHITRRLLAELRHYLEQEGRI